VKYKVLKGHHTGLTVRSLDVSVNFYRDLLGLEEKFSWSPEADYIREVTGYKEASFKISVLKVPGLEFYLELIEYGNIEQVEIDHRNGNPGIAHIAFQVEDLDQFYTHLVENNVKSVSKPTTPTVGPNVGGRIVYMIDPDGYRVELIQTRHSFGSFEPNS
jgi:catechol 2,3-dioxygenase-like lactoylglutathione lyase family enzyme